MKMCKKCGNEISIMSRYIHPILGKKYIICKSCFINLEKIIEQWKAFVIANPTNINSINIDGKTIKNNFEITVTSIMKTYRYVIDEEHSIDYKKNITEHMSINDNRQELFPENILQPIKI
jgi:hypothetical protein